MSNETGVDGAAGWEAIDGALARLYPNQEPRHWGTLIKHSMGGNDPLDGISAYEYEKGDAAAHWHYISFGMSELYGKESENKGTSGFGFEFTFRLVRGQGEAEPPQWPLGLLQNLARYVFKTGNVFAPGHYLPLNGPIAQGHKTSLHAAIFSKDAELDEIATPNGKVAFLQFVGATMDELAAAPAWNAERILELMKGKNPLLVTDLDRASILADAEMVRRVREGIETEGSSSSGTAVRELEAMELGREAAGPTHMIILAANAVEDFCALLRGRTRFGREFRLVGPQTAVDFLPSPKFSWERRSGEAVSIGLSMNMAGALSGALRVRRGDYRVPEIPEFLVRIVPTEIKDHRGENVLEVIG